MAAFLTLLKRNFVKWSGVRAGQSALNSLTEGLHSIKSNASSTATSQRVAATSQRVEVRPSVLAQHDHLAIDHKAFRLDTASSEDDGREAVAPFITAALPATDAGAHPVDHQPIAVMLDFVNPERAGRRPHHLRRLARSDQAGNAGDLTQHGRTIGLGAERATSSRSSLHSKRLLWRCSNCIS